MKLKRIQTVFLLILCAVMITVGFPVTVRADMGPKPSCLLYTSKLPSWKGTDCLSMSPFPELWLTIFL